MESWLRGDFGVLDCGSAEVDEQTQINSPRRIAFDQFIDPSTSNRSEPSWAPPSFPKGQWLFLRGRLALRLRESGWRERGCRAILVT
jgi:hypothetical protein